MKLKTSITIIGGCLVIFLFIMLPLFLSIQDKKDDYISSIKGLSFSLTDINNNPITEKSFQIKKDELALPLVKLMEIYCYLVKACLYFQFVLEHL